MLEIFSKLLHYRRHNLLAYRLLFSILVCSVFFTVLATIFQLYVDYGRDQGQIEVQMQYIQESYVPALSESLWYFDRELTETQLTGILQLPDIVYLEIQSEAGETVMQAGNPQAETIISRQFSLSYIRRGEDVDIGRLYVLATLKGVYQRLRARVFVILITQACTIFLLSICIVLILRASVTRHLAAMAKYTRELDLHNLNTHFALERSVSPASQPDELDHVVAALNDMQARVKTDIAERENAEKALRESEERFDLALSVANDGIWDWHIDSETLLFDSRYYTIAGYEPNEFPHAYEEWEKRIHPDDLPHAKSAIDQYLCGNRAAYDAEFRFLRKSGDYMWIRAKGRIVARDETGKPTRFVGTHADITKRKQAEEKIQQQNEFLESIINSLTHPFYVVDTRDYAVVMANSAARELCDASGPVTCYALSHKASAPCRGTERFCPMAEMRQHKKTIMTEHIHYDQDGNARNVEVHAYPIVDDTGQVVQMIEYTLDITKRKQAEEELRNAKEAALKSQHRALDAKEAAETAQQTAEAAQQAAEAAQQAAEAANRAKSAFLANMSHELRTPLNAILGFSQLLGHSTNLNSEQQEYLDSIRRSGEHLLTLINQVLDLSKIESGRITLNEKDVDLHCLLDDVEHMFHLRAGEKGLILRVERAPDLPRYVRADNVKLLQVLINLLTNAIKFTDTGEVTLEVTKVTTCEGSNAHSSIVTLQLSISDTGSGIRPDELDYIFEPFVQTVGSQKSSEGTGLGLAISRRFVTLMGGEIWVESDVGRGTTVTFHIQVGTAGAVDRASEHSIRRIIGLEPNQPRYRLLIVDDNADNRKLLVDMLHPFDFDLREAENGREAVDTWKAWQPHLIWMDLKMPVMNGYEATRQIRALEEQNQSPRLETCIIAVTAVSFEAEQEEGVASGCDDFMRKPFEESEIFDMLRIHLGLAFVYEIEHQPTDSAQQPQHALTPEALAALPEKLLRELRTAADEISVAEMQTLIERISEHNASLADALTKLVQHYRFDILQEVLEKSPGDI